MAKKKYKTSKERREYSRKWRLKKLASEPEYREVERARGLKTYAKIMASPVLRAKRKAKDHARYLEYMKDPVKLKKIRVASNESGKKWRQQQMGATPYRRKAMERAIKINFKCEACGRRGLIEIHHEGKDLRIYCSNCHALTQRLKAGKESEKIMKKVNKAIKSGDKILVKILLKQAEIASIKLYEEKLQKYKAWRDDGKK